MGATLARRADTFRVCSNMWSCCSVNKNEAREDGESGQDISLMC